jgi:hypothetical protein
MRMIHLGCLREWLNSKKTVKEGEGVVTYCWKATECELCQVKFPSIMFHDGTNAEKKDLTARERRRLGEPIEVLEYKTPRENFIVMESVTMQNIRIIHVVDMKNKTMIKVGRGHDADIRVTDISVSRFHAMINYCPEKGEYFLEDNNSKFGTLVLVRKPTLLHENCINYF